MSTQKEIFAVKLLGDHFAREFIHHARPLLEIFGLEGERAVRDGVRVYGRDRGVALRKQHLELGYKANLMTIFGGHYDLPADPRTYRINTVLNENVRRAIVNACSIVGVWNAMGAKAVGRIYCEEFHHAMWESYASGSQVNLTETLTQEGDSRCVFSVYQRPANIQTEKELRESYAQFDPDYVPGHEKRAPKRTAREAYEDMCVRLFQAMNSSAYRILGDKSVPVLRESSKAMALDFVEHTASGLHDEEEPVTAERIAELSPFGTREQNAKAWPRYNYQDKKPERLMTEAFFPAFEEAAAKAL